MVDSTGGGTGETDSDDTGPVDEYCADVDGDSFGDPHDCRSEPAVGYVEDAGDCDDNQASAYPGAAPMDDPLACMLDEDGDGYGSSTPPSAVVPGSDCDDADVSIYDCISWCFDGDGDGAGDPATCADAPTHTPPPGHVANDSDCDDDNANVVACAASCGAIGPNLTCTADMEGLIDVAEIEACIQSDLVIGANENLPPGHFSVWTDAQFSSLGFVDDFVDHSTGVVGGRVALLDSSGAMDETLYLEQVAVEPNTNYLFTAWLRNANSGAPPIISMIINGEDLIPGNSLVSYQEAPTAWQEVSVRWASASELTATIQIVNRQPTSTNNDLLMDDVLFRRCEGVVIP